MAAATSAAVAGPKTGDRHLTLNTLIDQTLPSIKAQHPEYTNARCRKQIIDVPVEFLGRREMPPDTRFEIAQRASCVTIIPCGKNKFAQAANPYTHWPRDFNQQLVGTPP